MDEIQRAQFEGKPCQGRVQDGAGQDVCTGTMRYLGGGVVECTGQEHHRWSIMVVEETQELKLVPETILPLYVED